MHKADVLLALYNNAKYAGPGFASQPMMKIMYRMSHFGNAEAAQAAIASGQEYFDYIDLGAGPRPLKVRLSGFDFDSSSYDRDHSHDGYAGEVIDQLRTTMIEQLQEAPKDSLAYLLSQIGLAFQSKPNSDEDASAAAGVSPKI